ncbi:MAG: hypothetical protein EA401_06890 [Planctomycetota bacterium]|nr:MAG: hypothetical protein EA401_06890 [Planctomycetota bacterium]
MPELRLLADENIDSRLVQALRADGHHVTWIAEQHAGIRDEAVLDLAAELKTILITDDTDFGELIYRQRLTSYGVLLLRLGSMPWQQKHQLLTTALTAHRDNFFHAFTVLSDQRLRIRPLQ